MALSEIAFKVNNNQIKLNVIKEYLPFLFWSFAADKENAAAIGNLGYCYSNGKGVPKDYD